jgi:hypothetical protein
VLSISLRKEGIKIVNTIANKATIVYIECSKALAYFIPIYLGIFGLIWLIAKFVCSRGFSKRRN